MNISKITIGAFTPNKNLRKTVINPTQEYVNRQLLDILPNKKIIYTYKSSTNRIKEDVRVLGAMYGKGAIW